MIKIKEDTKDSSGKEISVGDVIIYPSSNRFGYGIIHKQTGQRPYKILRIKKTHKPSGGGNMYEGSYNLVQKLAHDVWKISLSDIQDKQIKQIFLKNKMSRLKI